LHILLTFLGTAPAALAVMPYAMIATAIARTALLKLLMWLDVFGILLDIIIVPIITQIKPNQSGA